MKGKFYESEYEEALVDLLHAQGWEYTHGNNIARNNRETLILDDLKAYLMDRYPDLTDNDIDEVINHLRHVGGQTHFDLLRIIVVLMPQFLLKTIPLPHTQASFHFY